MVISNTVCSHFNPEIYTYSHELCCLRSVWVVWLLKCILPTVFALIVYLSAENGTETVLLPTAWHLYHHGFCFVLFCFLAKQCYHGKFKKKRQTMPQLLNIIITNQHEHNTSSGCTEQQYRAPLPSALRWTHTHEHTRTLTKFHQEAYSSSLCLTYDSLHAFTLRYSVFPHPLILTPTRTRHERTDAITNFLPRIKPEREESNRPF